MLILNLHELQFEFILIFYGSALDMQIFAGTAPQLPQFHLSPLQIRLDLLQLRLDLLQLLLRLLVLLCLQLDLPL